MKFILNLQAVMVGNLQLASKYLFLNIKVTVYSYIILWQIGFSKELSYMK